MMIRQNDVLILYIPFNDAAGRGKMRPALFVQRTHSGVKVFRITSKYATKSAKIQKRYYKIKDWKEAGLNKPSWIDIGESASFDLENFSPKKIGTLSTNDINSLAEFIEKYTG
ncbi:type II toxin-antitoxin system PemK/MazF family toxin [Enterococcus gilvus]|jgi:hypothetical protein|nr:type II toxin-antitoxin system PemK/MazF family toxin [Enterococcus gilvus]